jgi:hypothetical protein
MPRKKPVSLETDGLILLFPYRVLLISASPGPAEPGKDDAKVPLVDFSEKAIFSRNFFFMRCFLSGRRRFSILNRENGISLLVWHKASTAVVTNPLITLIVAAHKKEDQTVPMHNSQQSVAFNQIVFQTILDARFAEMGASGRLLGPLQLTGEPLVDNGFRMFGNDLCHPPGLMQTLQLSAKIMVENHMSDHG